jgi:DNA-binding PadR family transcriptional regulator
MTRDRNLSRRVRWMLEQAERDGRVRWTGEHSTTGKKIYQAIDAGREWARQRLEVDHDAPPDEDE